MAFSRTHRTDLTTRQSSLQPLDYREIPPGDNLLQSHFWGDFKSRFGWKPRAFLYENRALLLLERSLPGGYSLAYLPHPLKDLPPRGRQSAVAMFREMKKFLSKKTLCLRVDLAWESEGPEGGAAGEMAFSPAADGFKKAVSDVQAPDTVVLSLEGPEEDLMQAMKSKTRYNIRLAFRKGVEVRREGLEFLPRWYELHLETARRDRIAVHSLEYYKGLFETASSNVGDVPDLRIYSAWHEGDLLASVITAFYGGQAVYLYGASSDEKRNLMASYAVQWEVIKAASAAGCREYDLFGIPPVDNPDHPMHGLYRFKTGFGGRIVHRLGAWDLPVSRGAYSLFRIFERGRHFYYKKLKKR